MGKFKATILDINITILYLYKAKDLLNLPNKLMYFLDKTEYSISYILVGIIVGIQLVTICHYSKSILKQTSFEKINKKDLKSNKEIISMLTDREFYIKNKDNSLRKFLYKN